MAFEKNSLTHFMRLHGISNDLLAAAMKIQTKKDETETEKTVVEGEVVDFPNKRKTIKAANDNNPKKYEDVEEPDADDPKINMKDVKNSFSQHLTYNIHNVDGKDSFERLSKATDMAYRHVESLYGTKAKEKLKKQHDVLPKMEEDISDTVKYFSEGCNVPKEVSDHEWNSTTHPVYRYKHDEKKSNWAFSAHSDKDGNTLYVPSMTARAAGKSDLKMHHSDASTGKNKSFNYNDEGWNQIRQHLHKIHGKEHYGDAHIDSSNVKKINEARQFRHIFSINNEENNTEARVYHDNEWDEYRVKHFKAGRHLEKADYHTDDKDDAIKTAHHYVMGGKSKTKNITEAGVKGKHLYSIDYETIAEEKRKYAISDVHRIVDRLHVSTPDNEIEDDIRKRANKANWPKKQTDMAVSDAIKKHNENKKLYKSVMTGSFSEEETIAEDDTKEIAKRGHIRFLKHKRPEKTKKTVKEQSDIIEQGEGSPEDVTLAELTLLQDRIEKILVMYEQVEVDDSVREDITKATGLILSIYSEMLEVMEEEGIQTDQQPNQAIQKNPPLKENEEGLEPVKYEIAESRNEALHHIINKSADALNTFKDLIAKHHGEETARRIGDSVTYYHTNVKYNNLAQQAINQTHGAVTDTEESDPGKHHPMVTLAKSAPYVLHPETKEKLHVTHDTAKKVLTRLQGIHPNKRNDELNKIVKNAFSKAKEMGIKTIKEQKDELNEIHIMTQLKKVAEGDSREIQFNDGKTTVVPKFIALKAIKAFDALSEYQKIQFAKNARESYRNLFQLTKTQGKNIDDDKEDK